MEGPRAPRTAGHRPNPSSSSCPGWSTRSLNELEGNKYHLHHHHRHHHRRHRQTWSPPYDSSQNDDDDDDNEASKSNPMNLSLRLPDSPYSGDLGDTYEGIHNGFGPHEWEQEAPPKNEYPPSVYARHIVDARKRGDHVFDDPHTYLVAFDPDFNQFVANVAQGLQPYVTYRSDGGRYARGLVRDSEELQEIHKRFLRSSVAKGTNLRMKATLGRRKSSLPNGRWALLVHFAADILAFAPERVEAAPAVVEQSKRNHAERVIRLALPVAQNIDRQNHIVGEPLMKVVGLAARLGYPRCLDLWYYAPDHVRVYLDWRTKNAFRRKMTAATGGKFPFDGWSMQADGGGWRAFPLAEIIKQCLGQSDAACHAIINNGLLFADRKIRSTIKNAHHAEMPLGGGSASGPLAAQFIEHLHSLQASPDNVLSFYNQQGVGEAYGFFATY